MKKLVILTVLLTTLFGCSKEVKTIDYYSTHDQERAEVLKACEIDSSGNIDKNCTNAQEAQTKVNSKKMNAPIKW